MRKLMTALSFAALALIGINTGIAQAGVQAADTSYEFPTNGQENDVNLRVIADNRDDQRPAPDRAHPTGGDEEPSMRMYGT